MAMNDNLVQKMEFQIEIDRDSDFALLSKEIPAIVSDHLEDFINHCIEKLGLDNQFFILNQLVLDLGVLDIANFKNDLRVKFELQFLEEIKKQINKNSFAKIPDEELTFSIFVFFISNGGRPWWLNSQVRHFGEFAEKSFLLKASKFITHLKFFIKHPVYRKRIIENLSEDLLVRALIHDKKIDNTNSSESIYAIKRFLKHKYRHWNESKISLAFKEIVLQLFLHPHRIDQPWKLNLAIVEAIQDNHSGILTLDFPANSFLRNASSLSELNNFGLSMMEKSKRISSPERDYVLIQGFQFYLENGYTKIGKTDHNYKYQNINTLFRYLISNQLDELTELLLSLGRRSVIKKRFLESISQELLGEFFALMAPSKKKLLTWVVEVFQKVQDEYKPINQTFINVKKSINEITFELFLNKKLSSVNDENYLRFLFKQTARKFGIKYKDLLFFTIKSLEKGNKRTGVFKFSQTMILIYAKDILKSKGTLTVDRAIFGGNRPDARADDYSSKDFIFNLFLDLYRETQQTSESQVGIWLKSKLEVMSLDNTSDLLSLWELFAAKFELGAERLLLPVLVDKHRNPSIQLSAKSFDFWKNKYKLAGIYAQKKPNEFLLIRTLQENKKRLSRKVIKGVLMSLKPVDRVEKLDFQLISNFIHSGVSPMIPIYLNWLEKVLIDSQVQFKKRNVYNWFLQQLLVLPKKDLTLVRLQKKTLEFLQVDEGLMHEVDSTVQKSKSTIEKIQPSKAFHVESQERLFGTYTQQSTQAFFRIVELIGRADVLSIFQDSQKYGDKILFQMLTSKYESQFLNLLKKHQFNKELRDYILIQAPGWLKKDLINFINKASAGSWNAMVTSIRQYIEKTSWIGLKGLYLNDYIEKVLWDQIFDTTTFVIEDLVALVMQQALVEELITNKFWSDYHHFRSLAITGAPVAKSSYVNEIVVLEGSGFLSYIDALSKPQVSGGTSKQILESILIDFHFPIGHSFEDYQVEEFRSYINTLINSDRKVLIDILRNVDSPLVLQRFLAILDESALRFLIRENQNRLGFSLLFKKMEAIFSFFKIKNKTKINSFFTAWIGALYFEIGSLSNLSNVYARMFRVLEAEDVLTHTNVYSQNGWKPLLEILQLDGKDGVLFFEELGWRVSDKKVAQLVDSTDQLVGLPLTEANFKFYLSDLSRVDKRVIGDLLSSVESPILLQRLLKLLDESTLRFLIQDQHDILGFSSLLKQIEAVFSLFKIKNKAQKIDFFTVWIGVLYFAKPDKTSRISVYGRLFRVLASEGILEKHAEISGIEQRSLIDIFGLEGGEEVGFFEELGWRVSDKKVAQLVDSADQLVGLPLTEANFKSYLSDLSRVDKRVIGDLLSSVESPILLQRLLKLLDESTLRFLIQDQHDILGFSSLLKQIEAVFSLFKIKNKAQKIDFFTVWIGVLYFAKPDKTSRISVYGRLFRVLASEGILEKHAEISGIEQRSLIDIFGLEGGEEVGFFEELGWRVSDKKVAQLVDSADQLVGLPLTEANFKSYLSDLSRVDKRVIGDLLSSVESPILLQRLLKLLDESTLRFLIQGQHDILGFSSLLKQIEAVFSLFKIKNKAQRIDFFTVWIGVLYFAKPDKTSRISVYGRLFRVLASEGILGSDVFISDIDQKSLIDILQLDRYDEVLFLKELGGQNRILKSVEVPEKTSDSTDDFLHGKNPIQLILYPNNLSFEQYKLFIEYLFEEGILVYSHRTYIQEWMTFSTQYRSKKYLQTIVRLYFLNNLKFNSSATSMKAMLLYAFMENLNSDRYELRLFFSRLSFMPSLIWGIPWVLMEDMRKADLRKWKKVWLEVNANSSIDLESEDWHALSFNLLMNYGKSFVENQQNFRNRIPYLSKLISEAPLSELFMYRIHPDLFHEFLKIKPAKEIQNYFLEGRDPYLKLLKEKEFLITWFEGFFESSNEIQKAKFLGLFHKSFYSNVYTNTQQNLNTFLKGFFRLQEGQKSFWKVVEKKPEKTALFAQVYPEFFGNIKPITKTSVALLSPMEIFQMFLETGMLPKGMSGFQHLARDLSDFRENDLKKLRIVVHAGLQSEKGRQNFYKFATYVDLTWFLKLIHQDLPKELDELISHVNKKVQLDIFADLRISKKLDRLIFIAARWSGRGVLIKSPTEILLGIVEKWVDLVDSEVIRQVFSSDHHTPESVTIQKNSSSKLKRVIDELATVEEKEMVQMPPVEIEPIDYGEGVSIANAGLILFWPFYGRFFNALGMVGKEGMKGEKIRERAIQLLQYIATGRTEFEEWDLTLNKILCGATPDFPVSPSIDISAEEEELCGKLIKGSIYNWEKMRGTRMETFRETFVAREGRLYRKENRWELIVDKKAYDVLLDTLTWNISMINLSWMNTRINVQWR
jgi:hypothetical protein